jgi:hypothetical protein
VKRHDFDSVAFVFGLVFLAVGIPLLFSDSGLTFLEGRWVVPAFLIIAGTIVLASARRKQPEQEEFPAAAESQGLDDYYG